MRRIAAAIITASTLTLTAFGGAATANADYPASEEHGGGPISTGSTGIVLDFMGSGSASASAGDPNGIVQLGFGSATLPVIFVCTWAPQLFSKLCLFPQTPVG